MPASVRPGQAGDGAGQRHQVGREHALPEVAELDHEHDGVCRAQADGGRERASSTDARC